LDRFWSWAAKRYARVDGSLFSWSPNNIETLAVQAFVNGLLTILMWDVDVLFRIIGFGYFVVYFPIDLYFILRSKNNEE